MTQKRIRRKASVNIRVYTDTHEKLRKYSDKFGTPIPRTIDDAIEIARLFGKWDK